MEICCVYCGGIITLGEQENIVFDGDWFFCHKCNTNISIQFHSHSSDEELDEQSQLIVEKR